MDSKKVFLKNGTIGVLSQIITIILSFLSRSIFIKFLGVDILGLNSAFASILSMLSLAELGFQTAIVYSLYEPIQKNDYPKINIIMGTFGAIYRAVGIFIMLAVFVVSPNLQLFISDIEVTNLVRLYFIIYGFKTASTYFLSYRKILFYADCKEYKTVKVDIFTSFLRVIAQIFVLILFKEYILYLLVDIACVYIANIYIYFKAQKEYPYLTFGKFDFNFLKKILNDIKEVVITKICGYIYGSTDNLLISMFVSTVSVGYISNYSVITSSLKSMTTALFSSMNPIIGNSLVGNKDTESILNSFKINTHIKFAVAECTIIPFLVLCNPFIKIWIGESYIMEYAIPVLMSIDLYIHLIHLPTVEYIYAKGLFTYERNLGIISSVLNLTSSFILMKVIGIKGVLVGTVLSQIVCWIFRSVVVYFYEFDFGKSSFKKYWTKNLLYTIHMVLLVCICGFVCKYILTANAVINLLLQGIVIEIIIVTSIFVCFFADKNQRQLNDVIRKLFQKIIKK